MKLRAFLLAGLFPLALSTAACDISVAGAGAASETTFDRTLSVTGPPDLEVHTGSGDILVRVGTTNTVQVHGIIRTGFGGWVNLSPASPERVKEIAANPPIEQSGNTIRLGTQKWNPSWDGISISYEVIVPPSTRLRSQSGSGDQTIGDVAGPVEANSGSGNIHIGRASGGVRASAGSGDIELSGARSVFARTGSGSVRALAIQGDIDVQTGSGEVEVAQNSQGRVQVSTGSGDITVNGARGEMQVHAGSGDVSVEGTPAARWNVGASSGDVTLQLAGTSGFELDVRTSSGDIASALPVTMSGTLSKRELRGQVRGGGPRLEVATSSGDIRIH